MISKLLQKLTYGVNQSREVVDGQEKNIEHSSETWTGREPRPNRVNPAFDAEVGKDFPGLLKHNYRPAGS
jgi:hypothetical protein